MGLKLVRGWVIQASKFINVNGQVTNENADAANNGVNQGLRFNNVGVNHQPYDPNPQLTNFGASTKRVPKGF